MENSKVINVELRTSTRKGDNNILKRDGYLLGNIVGKGVESVAIAIKNDVFRRSMKEFGRNAVFTLVAEGQEYTVMVKEMHYVPVRGDISHLDFQIVSLLEKIKQEVAIKITGTDFLESRSLLVNSFVESIVLEGLPQNIPDEIVIDVSELEEGGSIQFSDVKLPEGMTSTLEADQKILTIVGSKMSRAVEDEDEEEVEVEAE